MDKVILTGANKGLGLDLAKRLLQGNYEVIAVCRTISEELLELYSTHPGKIYIEKFDLEYIEKIPELAKDLVKKYGAPYGLINNAGIGLDGLLATQHNSEISRVLKVNLEAPILLSKYLSRNMLPKARGRIINVTSIIASTGFSGLSVYAASKAGLEGFTKSLSRELGRVRVTVNCVAPGYMETDMTSGLEGKKLDSIKRRAPLGLPKPEDVSGIVEFLLSEDARSITGRIFTVDGGSTA